MTLEEAINYNGRLKIVTTNGNCKIGTIKSLNYSEERKEQMITFVAVDDDYQFYKSEIESIEKV